MASLINSYKATNMAELRTALENIKGFLWVVSRCSANEDATVIECGGNLGIEMDLVETTLTDGSKVYDLRFKPMDTRVPQAVHADAITGGRRARH